MIRARTSPGAAAISARRSYIGKVRALRACGRLKVIKPMPSLLVVEKFVGHRVVLFRCNVKRLFRCIATVQAAAAGWQKQTATVSARCQYGRIDIRRAISTPALSIAMAALQRCAACDHP